MTVKELVNHLTKLDQNLDIILVNEDDHSAYKSKPTSISIPIEVQNITAERIRLNDNSPALRYERSESSEELCIIQITSDF